MSRSDIYTPPRKVRTVCVVWHILQGSRWCPEGDPEYGLRYFNPSTATYDEESADIRPAVSVRRCILICMYIGDPACVKRTGYALRI